MAKTQYAGKKYNYIKKYKGKASPGPCYINVTDKFDYTVVFFFNKNKKNKAPAWKLGTEVRNTLGTGAKHDFYLRKDIDVL